MVIKTNNSSKNSNNLKYNITAGIKSLKKYEKKNMIKSYILGYCMFKASKIPHLTCFI